MANKKVSIIVPVYRTEAYLKRCVDSLINQTYKNIEIVLVNDGSPDRAPSMCDDYAKQDDRIKVIHKENGGLVSAWQAGVKASSCEYLCFVDSDDWVQTDMVEGMVSNLTESTEEKKEIVCCNFVINRFTSENQDVSQSKETKHYHGQAPGIYEGEHLEKVIKDNLLGHENRMVSMSRCMKLFSRGLIVDNIKYCNPRITMGEDVNIVLPALLDCERLVIMNEAHYYHYVFNHESMVHKYDSKLYEGIKTLYAIILDIYKEKDRENGKLQGEKEYLYLLLLALKNEIRGGAFDYKDKIKAISGDRDNERLLQEYELPVKEKANQMLYYILKHPNTFYISVIRQIFRIYDKMS